MRFETVKKQETLQNTIKRIFISMEIQRKNTV